MRETTNRGFPLRRVLPFCCSCLAIAARARRINLRLPARSSTPKASQYRLQRCGFPDKEGQPAEVLTEWMASFRFLGLPPGAYNWSWRWPGFPEGQAGTAYARNTMGAEASHLSAIYSRPARPSSVRSSPGQPQQAATGFQPVEVTDLPGCSCSRRIRRYQARTCPPFSASNTSELLLITAIPPASTPQLEDSYVRQRMMDGRQTDGILKWGCCKTLAPRRRREADGWEGGIAAVGGLGVAVRAAAGEAEGACFMMAGGRGAAFRQPVIRCITEKPTAIGASARSYSLIRSGCPEAGADRQITYTYMTRGQAVDPLHQHASRQLTGQRGREVGVRVGVRSARSALQTAATVCRTRHYLYRIR